MLITVPWLNCRKLWWNCGSISTSLRWILLETTANLVSNATSVLCWVVWQKKWQVCFSFCSCFLLLLSTWNVGAVLLLSHLAPHQPFLVRCLCMQPFFTPTLEVVTFHLRGWCMPGVFLLPAFTCVRYECHDLCVEPVWWNACVYRPDLSLYSHPKELGDGVRIHDNSKGNIPSTGGSEQCWTSDAASCKTVRPMHYWLLWKTAIEQIEPVILGKKKLWLL